MAEITDRQPLRMRGRALVALFAATAMLGGGAQALAPGSAAALQTDQCTGTDGTAQNCTEGGAGGDQQPSDDPPAEVIVVNDTKPVENPPCTPKPGYLCPAPDMSDPGRCVPRPGYLDCFTPMPGCPPGMYCFEEPEPLRNSSGSVSDCPLSLGQQALINCVNKRARSRKWTYEKLMRDIPRCQEAQTKLDELREFKYKVGASPAGWKAQGWRKKEEHWESVMDFAHCDEIPFEPI